MSSDQKISPLNPINNEDQIMIIGKKFDIKGDLDGVGAVIISGKVEGNVSASQVVVEGGGSIIGNITCQQLDVSGHVRGAIEVTDVVIRQQGEIEGDLNYSTIAIESGGAISGKLKQTTPKTSIPTSGAPRGFEPTKVQGMTRITFPIDLSQKLRSHESLKSAHISLLDGSPVPGWINLAEDKLGLMVDSLQLKQLNESNLKIELRLHVGSQYFDFTLPVQG